VLQYYGGASQRQILSEGGMSLSPIPAKLMYQLVDNKFKLVWDISIQEKSQKDWWNIRVDASTGTIIDKNNYMLSCGFDHEHNNVLNYNKNLFDISNYNKSFESYKSDSVECEECYEVFAMPKESPFYGDRTSEVQPSLPAASPFGWHDTDGIAGAEFTVTKGNNVNAYEDGDNIGYQPDGGPTLNFTEYPFDPIYSNTNQYEDAAITNLFYWNNIIHDLLYVYGFNEEAGNFQENNYGNSGAENDSVNAEAQDGSGSCNANFGSFSIIVKM
jgi:extracellular elastinolytic metalloproteinase